MRSYGLKPYEPDDVAEAEQMIKMFAANEAAKEKAEKASTSKVTLLLSLSVGAAGSGWGLTFVFRVLEILTAEAVVIAAIS